MLNGDKPLGTVLPSLGYVMAMGSLQLTVHICSSEMPWVFAQMKLSHFTTFFCFVLTAPWEQQDRLCAVCSWECTSMDNRTAEILWCLPPSAQIVPVLLLSLGFCGVFSKSFQDQLIVLKEIPWTGLKWQLSFHITCTKNLETLSEGKF